MRTRPDVIGAPAAFSWVAALTNGQVVYGLPSWAGSSGPVALPDPTTGTGLPRPDASGRLPWSTDWQRLMAKCRDERLGVRTLVMLTMWGRFSAPELRLAYGWFEPLRVDTLTGPQHGHCGVICWAEPLRGVWYTEHLAVGFAELSGRPVVERGNNRPLGGGLKPCMIIHP